MKTGKKNRLLIDNEDGFSLVEVLIAMMLFALFMSVYDLNVISNLDNSLENRETLLLKHLADLKMREIQLIPPDFSPQLAVAPKEYSFTEEEYQDYKYMVEYALFEIPNLAEIMGTAEEGESTEDSTQNQGLAGLVFNQLKENLAKMIWQVSITVTHNPSQKTYQITNLLNNENAKIKIKF